MLEFIVTNVVMFSLGAILYMMVRTLPRIEEFGTEDKKGFFERWATSEMPEKVDATLNIFLMKFLRRFRIFVLKLDNALTGQLKKIQPEADPAAKVKPTIDFKEISSGGVSSNGVDKNEDVVNNS